MSSARASRQWGLGRADRARTESPWLDGRRAQSPGGAVREDDLPDRDGPLPGTEAADAGTACPRARHRRGHPCGRAPNLPAVLPDRGHARPDRGKARPAPQRPARLRRGTGPAGARSRDRGASPPIRANRRCVRTRKARSASSRPSTSAAFISPATAWVQASRSASLPLAAPPSRFCMIGSSILSVPPVVHPATSSAGLFCF